MHRHQLLLLAERAQEAQGVHAKADQPDDRESHQTQRRADSDAQALTRPGSAEQHERQREPRRELHPHGTHERCRRGSHVTVGARAQRECE